MKREHDLADVDEIAGFERAGEVGDERGAVDPGAAAGAEIRDCYLIVIDLDEGVSLGHGRVPDAEVADRIAADDDDRAVQIEDHAAVGRIPDKARHAGSIGALRGPLSRSALTQRLENWNLRRAPR